MKIKKKPIIFLTILITLGTIGGTISYFSSEAIFPNIFESSNYNTEVIEKFIPPNDWSPGETTDKTIQVKNTGNSDIVVRVSYMEDWIAKNGSKLSNIIQVGGASQRVVKLNLTNEADWQKVGTEDNNDLENPVSSYYYRKILHGGESISFIDSVTLNNNVEFDFSSVNEYEYLDETKSTGTKPIDGKIVTKVIKKYISNEGGYAGATYTLTIKIETAQYANYKDVWPEAPEIVS